MPRRKEQFVNGEIYHVVIKGINGNKIFKDVDDHYRGIFSIYEFNNAKQIKIRERRKARLKLKEQIKKISKELQNIKNQIDTGRASVDFLKIGTGPSSVDSREKMVEVLAFCIMPNHLHLLLRQLKDGGIIKFMHKLGTGYGGYFNRKYGRQGHVFLKQFTAVHIKTEEQLKTVFVYIHTNPVSLIEPKWKEIGIKNPEKVIKFLEDYKWSSYPDYIGKKNFPSVTDREFMLNIMGDEKGCREFVESWIRYKGEIKEFPELALD
jgi:putative transposase